MFFHRCIFLHTVFHCCFMDEKVGVLTNVDQVFTGHRVARVAEFETIGRCQSNAKRIRTMYYSGSS